MKKKRDEEAVGRKKIPARGTAKELANLCEDHGILTKIISNKVIERWEGKPKGILQTLWERGFIDATNLSRYTMNGYFVERDITDVFNDELPRL
jgi:hypothetical protein